MPRQARPADSRYYARHGDHLCQGDLFTEVPLGLPWPPNAVDHKKGTKRFISGPFEAGFGLLLTPTRLMVDEPGGGRHLVPHRIVAPVLPLKRLVGEGALGEGDVDELRRTDHLVNYLYLPPAEAAQLPESVALLYAPTTLHHEYLEERRVAQLGREALAHLQRQLAAFFTGSLFAHEAFDGE